MAVLSSPSYDLDQRLFNVVASIIANGVTLSTKSAPLFSLLVANNCVQKVTSPQWQVPIHYGSEALQSYTAYSAASAPSHERYTALKGDLWDATLPVEWDKVENTKYAGMNRPDLYLTHAFEDALNSLEANFFGSGTGSGSMAGLQTALPFADTGAYFNIPATRTNFTSDILHHWINTTSAGSRTTTLFGGSPTVTSFSDADTGLLARLRAIKNEISSRGYDNFYAFCSSRVYMHLGKYMEDKRYLVGSMEKLGSFFTVPAEMKRAGLTVLNAGGTYYRFEDVTFVQTSNMPSGYDIILIPFRGPTSQAPPIRLLYAKMAELSQDFVMAANQAKKAAKAKSLNDIASTIDKAMSQYVQSIFNVRGWAVKERSWAFDNMILAQVQLVIPNLDACAVMAYNGSYS